MSLSSNAVSRIKAIKNFPALLKFLRDDLGWPIESTDVEDLTFDYTPEELGFDKKLAVKIRSIKQLRPMVNGQPWGIFYIDFEPKRLPVGALRRLLRSLVVKKRGGGDGSQPSWSLDDLLFISFHGEEDSRTVAFAHFQERAAKLPQLRTFYWDQQETEFLSIAESLGALKWPSFAGSSVMSDNWRKSWGTAFRTGHGEVISDSKVLSKKLAQVALKIRHHVLGLLNVEDARTGPLHSILGSFRTLLVHDLSEQSFADVLAQTFAYGLLAAKAEIGNEALLEPGHLAEQVPPTNPLLRGLFEEFNRLAGMGPAQFDEDLGDLGVDELIDLLNRVNVEEVLKHFGRTTMSGAEDPVLHFYEEFLKDYDKAQKLQRGVFYTPQPVVSYIVRSVHELLQTEFGLADGLADTTTWGEMLKKHPGLNLPPLTDEPGETRTISPDEPFVQILDPATGTATFLVEAIDVIYGTLATKWTREGLDEGQRRAAWNDYVPQQLLPRLHAFELMMAPYAIAHMKIGLKLAETGYRFGTDERARIYLTNALEPWVKQLPLVGFDALAHEAAAVNEIKRYKRFTVVIGNPPYAKLSSNRNEDAEALVAPFKLPVRGERNIQPLSDDYVKFFGFMLSLSRKVPACSFGMITNRGYLNGLIHRGVRQVLYESFSKLWTIDLHGDSNVGETSPTGRANENVFDIKQGVAITIGVKCSESPRACQRIDSWGTRAEKYTFLAESQFNDSQWEACKLISPNFFFQPVRISGVFDEFEAFLPLTTVMPYTCTGIKTHRDDLVLDFNKSSLTEKIGNFVSTERTDREVRTAFFGTEKKGNLEPGDNSEWSMSEARKRLQKEKTPLADFIRRITYRPYDDRFIFYSVDVIDRAREDFMSHMDSGQNLGLATTRQVPNCDFSHVLVTRLYIEMKTASHDRGTNLFPLYLEPEPGRLNLDKTLRLNLGSAFLRALATSLSLKQEGVHSLPIGLRPEAIFHYAYAVFHSPKYRSRYAELLKIEFPRLPLPGSLELFHALARLGDELTALHLLESPELAQPFTDFIGSENPKVDRVSWSDNTVWIDDRPRRSGETLHPGACGFPGVPEAVWKFHIGGYQVCHKWLKDRKGRTLTNEDITHYQKIIVSISATIRIMAEIDEVIESHGGWPGAFQGGVDG